ncbi:unnamed protein product, partial [marine sediment metagenome]
NKKSYSCSRGLVVPLNPKGTGEWIADYLVICDIQDNLIDEYELINERIYELYAGDLT